MPSEAQMLADKLFDEFLAAESDADREAIRPAALAAAEGALVEAIGTFKKGTLKILELAAKVEAAIRKVGAPGSRKRLKEISDRLGSLQSIVHDAEGMRTTWTTNEEFEATFPDENDVTPSGSHDVIPAGPPVADTSIDLPLSTSKQYQDLADEYLRLYRSAEYKDNASEKTAKKFAEAAVANKARYETVGDPIGVPWWFIAGVHLLESTFNFSTHLHNGDKLTAKTFRVPAGRPANGNPPFKWEASAEDALRLEKLGGLTDWSLSRALYRWEAYNGFGYRKKLISTPYLWSFSTIYKKGKFVGDGVFDATAVSQQCGAATFLKALVDIGAVTIEAEVFTEGGADDAESGTADADAVVAGGHPNIDHVLSTNVDFQTFFEQRLPDLKHFKWHEFMVKGGGHSSSGLNTDPPQELWPNILQLARVLDRFREEVGQPVVLTSVYRSPAYNATLPGAATSSQHMQFRAADVKVPGFGNPQQWATIFKRYRDEKMFEGGVGLYNTFVHVDTRGINKNW